MSKNLNDYAQHRLAEQSPFANDVLQQKPVIIRFIHYPNALPSSIFFALDTLQSAYNAYLAQHRIDKSQLNIRFELVNFCPSKLSSRYQQQSFLSQSTTFDAQDNSPCTLIFLSAIWRNPMPLVNQSHTLIDWLQKQHAAGAVICSIGTASCLLAESGLLDSQSATTHWFHFDQFEKRYPKVHLQRNHLITQAKRLFCAGSINAVADLSIYFAKHLFGQSVAQQIQHHFSPEIRKPVEQQLFNDQLIAHNATIDERISLVRDLIHNQLSQKISTQALAQQVELSPRQLQRVFKKETGKTISQFKLHLRIQQSEELLNHSDLSVSEIAQQLGFSDCSHFIDHFKRVNGITPRRFRQRLRSKLFI